MPPINDDLASATILSGDIGSDSGTLVGSTLENGPWTLGGGWTELTYWGASTTNDGRSVIYKRTPVADELFSINIAGSGFNPYIEVYRDAGPSIDMEFIDWAGDGTASPPEKVLSLQAGETYYFFVWNWEFNTSEGTFTLGWELSVPPSNDDIANAIIIQTDQIVSGSTILATTSPAETTALGTSNPAIWYKWKAPSGELATELTKLTDTTGFHRIVVYPSTAGPNAGYTDLGSAVASIGNTLPVVTTGWTTEPVWYYIAVIAPGTPGEITFQVTVPNEADPLNSGVYLSTQPNGWHVSNNVGATTEVGEPVHAGVGTHHSVWLYFRANHLGEYTFNIERVWGDLENPVIAVYRGDRFSGFGALTEITSDATEPLPSVTFTLGPTDEDEDISIVIAGRAAGQEGGFVLNWEFNNPTQTGNIADAVSISGTGSLSNVNLDGSMPELDNYSNSGFNFADGYHWYKAEPTSDGSLLVTITVPVLQSQRFYIWKGTDIKTQVCQARVIFGSGSTTKILNIPVEAGETYYVMFQSPPQYNYSISWELNTEAPINFTPTSVGDFDTNSGGSDSGGELVFGPNDYVQHTILPSGHARATDSLYIGFAIRYGNANRMLAGSGDVTVHVLEVYSVSGTLIGGIRIYESLAKIELTGNLSLLDGMVSSYRLSEDAIYCELIITQVPSADYTTAGKRVSALVGGSDPLVDLGATFSNQLIGYFKLGYINEPSTAPNLDLRISDVVVKTLGTNDSSLPNPSFYTAPTDRLTSATGLTEGEIGTSGVHTGTGYRNVESLTAYTIIDDPTGGGRGKVLDASSAADGFTMPGQLAGVFQPSVSLGWWTYFTNIGTGGTIGSIVGTDIFFPNATFLTINIENGGGIYIELPGVTSSTTRMYAHRKMTTGSWHHIEIEITTILPRIEGRWWIDGEEQTPFVQDRGFGRIWGYIAGGTVGHFSNLRGYVTDATYSLKGPIGPVKSSMIVPDASGTHELGVLVNYTEGPGEEKWITSTNDGSTYTPLGATDPVHGFIDEWPNVDGATSDIVGEANRDSWIEYSFQDVGGSEDVKFVNAFTAIRPMHIVHADFTGLHSYPDLQPHSRDNSDYGMMSVAAKYMLGDNEVNVHSEADYGFDGNWKLQQVAMGHAPDRTLWTPANLADIVARWGYAHFYGAGQQGNALEASMMEVIMADSPGSTLGIFTPPAPEINLITQFIDQFTQPFEFTSCDAWQPSDKRTDPNMRRKIWLFPSFQPDWDIFKVFWRMTPAYDPLTPGFDGIYTNDGLDDIIWTDGEFFGYVTNRPEIYAVRWGNNYYDGNFNFSSAEMRVMSPSILYNPCSLGNKVDEDGNVTIEAYVEDTYGVQSAVASLVFNISKGLCCGAAMTFNKIVSLR